MPFCSKCGIEVDLHFCWRCGAPIIPVDYELVESAVDEFGRRFTAQYEKLDSDIGAAFDDVRIVFHQAIGCCKSGFYLAATVMCREAIEGVIYLAVIHTIDAQGQPFINAETLKKFSRKEVRWRQLKKWATDRKYVDESLKTTLERIRELGNFSAHYAERVMRERAGVNTPYQVSISPEEAYRSLNVVRQFIMTVIEKWTRDFAPNRIRIRGKIDGLD